MAKIALHFGSYNPIHRGHTAIAKFVLKSKLSDEVWFVVSPENPLKTVVGMAPEADRLAMAKLAVKQELGGLPVKISDIEFSLPRPSYTIDTLRELAKKHPEHSFSLVVGTDIIAEIERWREYQTLIADYDILVYPREGYSAEPKGDRMIYMDAAPRLDHSSTAIRTALAQGNDVSDGVSDGVAEYIAKHGLYTVADRLADLNAKIEQEQTDAQMVAHLIERGKLLYKTGEYGAALNDFNHAKELGSESVEAQHFVEIINDILNYFHKDTYNP